MEKEAGLAKVNKSNTSGNNEQSCLARPEDFVAPKNLALHQTHLQNGVKTQAPNLPFPQTDSSNISPTKLCPHDSQAVACTGLGLAYGSTPPTQETLIAQEPVR